MTPSYVYVVASGFQQDDAPEAFRRKGVFADFIDGILYLLRVVRLLVLQGSEGEGTFGQVDCGDVPSVSISGMAEVGQDKAVVVFLIGQCACGALGDELGLPAFLGAEGAAADEADAPYV